MDMTMIASGTFTRSNLQLAFDEYVSVHGEVKARATLKEATGVEDIKDVSETKIINGVAALISTLTIPTQPRMSARGTRQGRSTLAAIHSRLEDLASKVFNDRKAAST